MNEKEQPLLKPKRGTGPTPDSTNIVLSSKATGRDIVNTWISVLEKMAQDEEAFEYIRSTYFPQWDTARKWTMRNTHPDCVGFGLCDSKGKMIVVRNSPPGGPQVALIHEICHAVASIYHDKKWQRRMEMAALKAESIGDKELAAEIRKEYTAYFDPDRSMKPTAEMVYNQVRDAVLDTHWSFEDVVAFVAEANGYTSTDLLSKYKKLREVYDDASN